MVEVAEEILDDLRLRLDRSRLPADFGNTTWAYGTNTAYLKSLIKYWRYEYDRRQQESAINQLQHYQVEIGGIPIHFVRQPGSGPAPLPLVLTHGWPWTFWDYRYLIGPLADPTGHGGDESDSFDVIVPSLPGFGFSSPLARVGVTWLNTADAWLSLMRDVLGYERFVAFGGDLGNSVTLQLGHKYPDHVAKIHFLNGNIRLESWNTDRPWDLLGAPPPGLTTAERERTLSWQRRFASHIATHVLLPQTLAHSLNDSPAGLCSWLIERRCA